MAMGSVKWFDGDKGFGFIKPDIESNKDIFVHYSGIQGHGFRSLEEGQRVSYDVTDGPKGDQAANVQVLQNA